MDKYVNYHVIHCNRYYVTIFHSLQLIRMGVRNTNINPRSYHDNFVLRHPMYMQPEIVVKDGGSRVSFV